MAVLGKSSECGMCMAPIVTQATRSSFTMESLSIRYLRKSTWVVKKSGENNGVSYSRRFDWSLALTMVFYGIDNSWGL